MYGFYEWEKGVDFWVPKGPPRVDRQLESNIIVQASDAHIANIMQRRQNHPSNRLAKSLHSSLSISLSICIFHQVANN